MELMLAVNVNYFLYDVLKKHFLSFGENLRKKQFLTPCMYTYLIQACQQIYLLTQNNSTLIKNALSNFQCIQKGF